MENNDVLSGNKLIAEFMGISYRKDAKIMKVYVSEDDDESVSFDCEWHPDAENIKPREDGMKELAWTYEPDKNWCQLMPVYLKYNKVRQKYDTTWSINEDKTLMIQWARLKALIQISLQIGNITKFHSAIVEFLQWYNGLKLS